MPHVLQRLLLGDGVWGM